MKEDRGQLCLEPLSWALLGDRGKLETAPGLRGLALGGEDEATLTMGAVESLAGRCIEMKASGKASWKRHNR